MPQIKGPKLIYQYLKKTNTLECQHILVPTISVYQWEKLFLIRTLSQIEHASISHKFCGAQRWMYSVEHSNSKCHALIIHPNACTQYSSRSIKRGTWVFKYHPQGKCRKRIKHVALSESKLFLKMLIAHAKKNMLDWLSRAGSLMQNWKSWKPKLRWTFQ